MNKEEFRPALDELSLSQMEIARLLKISDREARRYASGDAEIPGPVEAPAPLARDPRNDQRRSQARGRGGSAEEGEIVMKDWERQIVEGLCSMGHSVQQTDITGIYEFNGRMLNIAQLQAILSDAAPTDGPTLRELLKQRKDKS